MSAHEFSHTAHWRHAPVSRRLFTTWGVGGAALLCGLGQIGSARAQESVPQDLLFKVTRGGTQIGTHRVQFRANGDGGMTVHTRIDLAVKVAFVTAFRFRHDAAEVWNAAERVVSVKSETNDNGEKLAVVGTAVREGFKVIGPEGPYITRPNLFTSNTLWHPEVVEQSALINVQHGGEIGLTAQRLPDERVATPSGEVMARRHHVITPHLAGDLWHDETGRWVKAIIDLKGETVHYVLAS